MAMPIEADQFPRKGTEIAPFITSQEVSQAVDHISSVTGTVALIENVQLDVLEPFNENGLRVIDSLAIKTTRKKHGDSTSRTHELLRVEVGSAHHRLWKTEPASGHETKKNVLVKLGFSQIIEKGLGFKFHVALAHRMPDVAIHTVATLGMGPTAEYPSLLRPREYFRNLSHQGFDDMVEQDTLLVDALQGEDTLAVAISMDSIIINSLLRQNKRRRKPASFGGVVYCDPALVAPENAKEAFSEFGSALMVDGVKEFLFRTPWKKWPGKVATMVESRPPLRNTPTMLRQALDFAPGTPVEEIEQVAETHPMAVIAGLGCPLTQAPMWYGIQNKFPGVNLNFMPGVGHAFPADFRKTADMVVNSSRKIGAYKAA